MGRKLFTTALAVIAAALAVAGCGSSSGPSASPVIRRAAYVTGQAVGVKMSGSGTVTISAPQHVTVTMSMAGTFDRRDRSGTLTALAHAAGREVPIHEMISGLTMYMPSTLVPNGSALTRGKPWLKLDIGSAFPGGGLSSLPTTSDPAQFVDYLRAVSANTTKLGTATIRGVTTTHYHAVIDLNRYASVVPAAQRKALGKTIKTLEAALGGHTMPVDVWIDSHHLVRREKFGFTECVSGMRESIGMTMDLYDYGPQPKPRIPPSSKVYDATPLVSAALSQAKFGCSS